MCLKQNFNFGLHALNDKSLLSGGLVFVDNIRETSLFPIGNKNSIKKKWIHVHYEVEIIRKVL